jgi:histone deacetylase 1/2
MADTELATYSSSGQRQGSLLPIAANGGAKPKVAYFYDSDVGNYAYGAGHPMKPHRIRMAHALIMNYGLYKKMEIYRAKPATKQEMCQFHTDEYVEFLSRVTPENMENFAKEQGKCMSTNTVRFSANASQCRR